MMLNPGQLTITAHGDREIVITRVFNAPRKHVFAAWTRPELVKQWLLGPPGWSMPVCEIDLKIGGKYRYQWQRISDGQKMGMGGVYQEIVPPKKMVVTEKFDDAWYPGQALITLVLTEKDGKTTVTQTMQYESQEACDAVLKSPMESGVAASFDRMAELLATMA